MNKLLADPIKNINCLNEVVPKLIDDFEKSPSKVIEKIRILLETFEKSKISITFDSQDAVTKFAATRVKVLMI